MTTAPVLTPFLADAVNAKLEDWGPLKEATGPEMSTAGVILWEEGDASAGIWECAPGPSYWKLETHEVIQVIAGSMTVTPEGGEPLKIGAGDTAVFPKGWAGTWHIHETLRKVYAIF
jgi:uncharacterized cupin superfamily protein